MDKANSWGICESRCMIFYILDVVFVEAALQWSHDCRSITLWNIQRYNLDVMALCGETESSTFFNFSGIEIWWNLYFFMDIRVLNSAMLE